MCLEAHGNQKWGGLGRIMEAPGIMFWHCMHGIILDGPQCGTHSISVGSPTLCTVAEGMPVKPSVKALHAMAVAATNRADLDMAQPVYKRARWSKSNVRIAVGVLFVPLLSRSYGSTRKLRGGLVLRPRLDLVIGRAFP